MYKYLLTIIILLIESIIDIKTYNVYLPFNILIILIGLTNIDHSITFSLIYPLLLLLINLITKGMGYGDIEIIFSLCFIYSFYELTCILLFSSILNLMYSFFMKMKEYPFVPFLLFGTILTTFF